MITLASRAIRIGAKAVLWVVLGLIGLIGLLVVGWVPPELAAMLGSRRRTSGTDIDTGPHRPTSAVHEDTRYE